MDNGVLKLGLSSNLLKLYLRALFFIAFYGT